MTERTCTIPRCRCEVLLDDWCMKHYDARNRRRYDPAVTKAKAAAAAPILAVIDMPQPNSVTYTITVPAVRPYLTVSKQSPHWSYNLQKKAWRDAGWAAARMDTTIPRDKPLGFVRIIATVHITDTHRQDVSNFFPTFKAIIDGFCDAGILVDDSDSHLIGPDPRRGYTLPPRIVFTLEELTD